MGKEGPYIQCGFDIYWVICASRPIWFPPGFVAEGFQEWQHLGTATERN